MNERAHSVLDFWLGPLSDEGMPADDKRAQWWKKDPEFDAEITRRFGADIAAAEAGELDPWLDHPRSALAVVILCDQFTRNTRRGTGAMYSADAKALGAARDAIERGHDAALSPMEAYFLYMPLMHAEDVEAQRQCVSLFEGLAAQCTGPAKKSLDGATGYARQHAAIVERFGRFPHRNRLLGRDSTAEEEAFLSEPGSSF